MNILINMLPASFWDNIDCLFGNGFYKEIVVDKNIDIPVYNLKNYWPFLLKKETEKIKKEFSELDNNMKIVFSESVTDETKEYFSKIRKVTKKECFFNNLPKILNKFENPDSDLYIISNERDNQIFDIIEAASKKLKVISLITNDENFFDEVSEYALTKYGIGVNLKDLAEVQNKGLAVILNLSAHATHDFSDIFKYVIDLPQKHEIFGAKYLVDFSSIKAEKLRAYPTEYCYFVEKEHKILKLNWKISKIS